MLNSANIKDAVYLIDDDSFFSWAGFRTGWDYCGDGSDPKPLKDNDNFLILNSYKKGEVYAKRDCVKFEGGTLTFEMLCKNISGEGAYIAFGTRTDSFLKFVTKGEALFIEDKKVADFEYGQHYVKFVMNLALSKVSVYIDARAVGEFDFNKPSFAFDCLRIGFDEEEIGAFCAFFVKLYVNYLFNDACLNRYIGELPDEYIVECTDGASVQSAKRVLDNRPEYTYKSMNIAGSVSKIRHCFEKSSGNLVFEIMYLLNEANGRIKISLNSDDSSVVSVYDDGDELYCYNTKPLRKHHKTVWQTLRIYADVKGQNAQIWLNGKKTDTVKFENQVDFIDNFSIEYAATADSSIMFSDILLWVKPQEPQDYVPKPIVPKKKGDHVIGMTVCSLWREGTHKGWDCISPFDDVKPLLGFYDEGLPETSDWEIKWMVEHGIDYELYCWYSSEEKEPIKTTHLHSAWLDGHFYAKYSHMEKFALLWEALNCKHPTCLQDFKDNLVPYWLDYFFSDERYMRIDNKAVMSCFGVRSVQKDLGGIENVKEGLAFLREEVKKLGYDDLIIMGSQCDPVQLQELGFDAFHAYNWGRGNYTYEYNVESINAKIKRKGVHVVPTISVGFNNVGWEGVRVSNLSVQDFYKTVKYCMDEVLPTYQKNSWKSKTLQLSTWNEFGEGTYIMPSGLNGFGYLDALRNAVCIDEPHKDIIPTPSQQARISYLRPQNRYKLASTKYDVRPLSKEEKVVAEFTFKNNEDLEKWDYSGFSEFEIKEGKLIGKASAQYPVMTLKNTEFISSEIAYMKIVCTNRHGEMNCPTYVGFDFKNNIDNKRAPRREGCWCDDFSLKEYLIELDMLPEWRNIISDFAIIPTLGGTFEIESITFYASVPHKTIYDKYGKQLLFGDYLMEKGGELYIPFDPNSGILDAIGYGKYEWLKEDRTLMLWNNEKKESEVEIVLDRAYIVKDNEIYTLLRPPFLKDGIPAIAFSDIEKIFEIEILQENNNIYIK